MDRFKDFEGIRKEKDVSKKDDRLNSQMFDLCHYFMGKFTDLHTSHKMNKVHELVNTELKEIISNGFTYTVSDIKDFVIRQSDQDLDSEKSLVMGVYSGLLLENLTLKNREKGITTSFFMDGHGARFDSLFINCRHIDELFLENFSGDYICSQLCSFGGKGTNVVLNNIQGAGTLWSAARFNGEISCVVLANSSGDYSLSFCGGNGRIGALICANNSGKFVAYKTGYCKGRLGLYVLTDNNFEKLVDGPPHELGMIDRMIIHNNSGRISWGMTIYKGKEKINTLFTDNSMIDIGELADVTSTIVDIRKITGDDAKLMEEQRIDELICLSCEMKDAGIEKVVSLSSSMEKIYSQTKK